MASIEKRGDAYRFVTTNGVDENGKYKKVSMLYYPVATTPKKLEKELENASKDFEKRVRSGQYFIGETKGMTFIKVMELWKRDIASQELTQRVQEDYCGILKRRIIPEFGTKQISKITAPMIQKIITDMNNEGLAPRTVRTAFVACNAPFKYAFQMSIIESNPCDRIKLPKMKKDTDLHYFDVDQAKTFLNIVRTGYDNYYAEHDTVIKKTGETRHISAYTEHRNVPLQLQCFYYLAVYGGFRKGELLGLTWNDIDMENHTVNIHQAVSDTKEQGLILKGPKTAAGYREIQLPAICFSLLAQWKMEELALAQDLKNAWAGSPLESFDDTRIFIQDTGKPMDSGTPYQRFKDIIKCYNDSLDRQAAATNSKAKREQLESQKLPDIRLHDLRHTSATLLLSQNVDVETVSHRLGHSRASITLDVYGHAMKSMDTVASGTLERMFGNA